MQILMIEIQSFLAFTIGILVFCVGRIPAHRISFLRLT